jgi:pimeloyl-ACP methyl ester carboxylesterase
VPPTALCVFVLASVAAAGARAEVPGIYREALPTPDGVRATLYHYLPEPGLGQRPALLLLPDVGTTRRAYDFDSRGLARYLAWYGVEVFVLEYRGSGASDWPADYGFETLLENDCEAAFARALAGRARIYVGGWGLGGTLAGLLASRHAAQVAGFIGLQAAARSICPTARSPRSSPGSGACRRSSICGSSRGGRCSGTARGSR